MVLERKTSLKQILESSEGIHLTAYLVNRGELSDLKLQLNQIIEEANHYLVSALDKDEQKKFLEPLTALLEDARIFENMKGNIGIFRTRESFRILNISIDLETQCHVATSFHVKPLLKWMQADRNFLLLGIKEDSGQLFLGSQSSIKKIDTVFFPQNFRSNSKHKSHKRKAEAYSWMNQWLEDITKRSKPKLFLAGETETVEEFRKNLKYRTIAKDPAAHFYSEFKLSEICAGVRATIKLEARKQLEQALMEFRFAEENNLVKKNIFQIAKAAVEGKIRKLIIADGINIFGKIDKKTGGLALHPFDIDHEDDDILDDLAQTVLAAGGEVVVANRDEIPKGRPVLALLDSKEIELEMKSAVSLSQKLRREAIL